MDNTGSVTEPEQTPESSTTAAGETTDDTSTGSVAEEPATKPARRRSSRRTTPTTATDGATAEEVTTAETASPAQTTVDGPVPSTAEDRAEAATSTAEGGDVSAAAEDTDDHVAQKAASRSTGARARTTGTRTTGSRTSSTRTSSRKKAAEAGEAPAEAAAPNEADAAAAPAGDETPTVGEQSAVEAPAETAEDRAEAASAAAETPAAAEPEAVEETPTEDAATAAEAVEPDAAAQTPTGNGASEDTGPEAAEPAPSPMSLLFQAPDLDQLQEQVRARAQSRKAQTAEAHEIEETEDTDDDGEGDDGDGRGRSRRGGRRGRGRGRSSSGGSDSTDEASTAADADSTTENETGAETAERTGDRSAAKDEDTGETSSRRRRRRRRGDADLELTGGEDDDPPNTVTRVRAPRSRAEAPSNKVTSVKGSTRLEAKRQRRRESRETGRRRHGITEAEFLARRESVDRQMIVRQVEERIQIGVLEDGVLAEHFVSKTQQDSLIGNVYLGKVQNVLPSMEAAFIDIGRGRNAVLYAGEVNWNAPGLEGQPRRIEVALKSGDPVLVQVTKDPIGHKGARLTSQISLPGRFLVYVPGGSMTGISRKLPDNERQRLKKILKDRLPEGAGVIVRTAAEGASEEELTNDINRLRAQWEGIQQTAQAPKTLAPQMLYAEPDLTIKVVRDVFNEDFSKLIVSGEHAWDTIEAYVTYVAPDLLSRLEKWEKDEDLFTASRIDEQIAKALDRKVFLPSGGSLVIDRTEAMTVVDVNTGRFTGSGGNLEETVTKNNLEAAEEIVRQLRLRDIGGIIVIDFIDMVLEANRDLVLRRLVECLGRDRTKHQVAEVTSLGLVQMTRKRMGTGLLEVFSESCEACGGRGIITHGEPVEHRRHAGGGNGGGGNGNGGSGNGSGNGPGRSEKKRNRRSSSEGAAEPAAPAPTQDPEAAERAAKARAAMGNIAKALHPTDEHGEHGETAEAAPAASAEMIPAEASTAGPSAGPGEHVSGAEGEARPSRRDRRRRGRGRKRREIAENAPAETPSDDGSAAGHAEPGGDVELTLNGERVTVPHGHRASSGDGDLTLDSLSRAFDAAGSGRGARQPDDAVASAVRNALLAADAADDGEVGDDVVAVEDVAVRAIDAAAAGADATDPGADVDPAGTGRADAVAAAAFPAETPTGAPAEEPARPRRRSRRAASSGVGDASTITVVDTATRADTEPAAVFSSADAATRGRADQHGQEPSREPAAAPTVLGVGVSAADLARPDEEPASGAGESSGQNKSHGEDGSNGADGTEQTHGPATDGGEVASVE
ncbi:hypothetical protein BKD30_07875 [Tersicoccus phoenicis]|uniref:Ribonuclease E n=2 Tax=Tersicoccus phoenicis TaxID=554083 RepID=A0A1R1LAX1_9MICC|nr:hypothetical protein BKD30_07875 [Tersicoccus phoenicis]